MSESNGINRLARVLQDRMKRVGNAPPVIEMATVKTSGVIRLDAYELDIPLASVAFLYGGLVLSEGDRILVAFVGDQVVVIGNMASKDSVIIVSRSEYGALLAAHEIDETRVYAVYD